MTSAGMIIIDDAIRSEIYSSIAIVATNYRRCLHIDMENTCNKLMIPL